MIKKLSAIFLTLSVTSCTCYGDAFESSSQSSVEETVTIETSEKAVSEINKSVFFENDSFALSPNTKEVLNEEILPYIKGKKVIIEGHCDERGSIAYNKRLGKERASAVKNYLVKNGADSAQIKTVSYGELKPLDLDHSEEAWAKNRRAVTISAQ